VVKVNKKVRAVDRLENLILEGLMHDTRSKGSHSLTCTSMRLSTNGMNYAFAFPAEAGSHFPAFGGMKG